VRSARKKEVFTHTGHFPHEPNVEIPTCGPPLEGPMDDDTINDRRVEHVLYLPDIRRTYGLVPGEGVLIGGDHE